MGAAGNRPPERQPFVVEPPAANLGLDGVKAALLRECVQPADHADPAVLASRIKRVPIRLRAPRPLAEAISSAGGVRFDALDERLMLVRLPGVFCAGEMIDWEAPTGGYLLTASFATGRAAAMGAVEWAISQRHPPVLAQHSS